MNTISAYVFRQALGPLLAILGALAAIAILTQGLNQLDIIITNRRAGFAFAWVTRGALALPQLISLILPMAVFIAVVYALNRMHSESEIAVLYGAGVSRQRLARPILQLAVLAAIVHLIINLSWCSLGRSRNGEKSFYDLRTDMCLELDRRRLVHIIPSRWAHALCALTRRRRRTYATCSSTTRAPNCRASPTPRAPAQSSPSKARRRS